MRRNISPTIEIEQNLWQNGFQLVCGIDEVGRGCFAGPVVAGAVIFPQDIEIPEGLKDSKLLTAKQRERLEKEIKIRALAWSVGVIEVKVINNLGIGDATQLAFKKSIRNISHKPDFVVIDAFHIKHLARKKQRAVKDGDKICASISAASVIAKVYRDDLMTKLHAKYPHYHFDQNKGYGTKDHQQAIKDHGLSDMHRSSFDLEKFL